MTILFAADLDADDAAHWFAELAAALPGEQLVRSVDVASAGAIDIALVANPAAGALAGLPNLKLVQSLWAGVDRLLEDRGVPADVPLARMVDPSMNDRMAETALWAVLGLHRGGFAYAAQQRTRRWRPVPLRRADEVGVAVLGLGEMGRATARRLVDNGYRVVGWSRSGARVDGVASRAGAASLAGVLAEADIVVDLLPLTPATAGLFDATTFAQMRPGVGFVNLARGAHVVEADLLQALDRGHVAHAVLDVFQTEPLPAGHPFWSHAQVTVLPHAAAPTDPRSAAAVVAANVGALRRGEPLRHLVDRGRGY